MQTELSGELCCKRRVYDRFTPNSPRATTPTAPQTALLQQLEMLYTVHTKSLSLTICTVTEKQPRLQVHLLL